MNFEEINRYMKTPIKVHNISFSSNKIVQTVIFLTFIPKNINDEIKKLDSLIYDTHKFNNKKLKKFFGVRWKYLLGIQLENKKKMNITTMTTTGGDINVDLFKSNLDDETFSFDIIEEQKTEKIKEKKTMNKINIPKKIVKIKTKTESREIFFILKDAQLVIYPEDNIFDLKKKIFLILGIPMYRQHLWVHNNNFTKQLNYEIFDNDNSRILINIMALKEKHMINILNGIPILRTNYNKYSAFKINGVDVLSLIMNIQENTNLENIYLIDLNSVVKNNLSSSVIRNKKNIINNIYYSLIIFFWPMISLEVFYEYVKDKNNIKYLYPDLEPNLQNLYKIYKFENQILDMKYDILQNKKLFLQLKNKSQISIISALLENIEFKNNKEKLINLRNLFDLMELDEDIDGLNCCHIDYDKNIYNFLKVFRTNKFVELKEQNPCLIFRKNFLFSKSKEKKQLYLFLYQNGLYRILSNWEKENNLTFEDVIKLVTINTNPIITKINNLSNIVFLNSDVKLNFINKSNVNYNDININILYPIELKKKEFIEIKEVVRIFEKSEILLIKEEDEVSITCYFQKGAYKFNMERLSLFGSLSNTYLYLTNKLVKGKWIKLFKKIRTMRISFRFKDLLINIRGIKEKEFAIVYEILLVFFDMIEKIKKKKKKNITSTITSEKKKYKKINQLKEIDPILYNFGKKKNKKVYSRICQKKLQPKIIDNEQYKKLTKEEQKRSVLFWNYSNLSPTRYYCPHKQYKYLKFIANKHPKNYCLPCCFKNPISKNNNNKLTNIFNICMKDKVYSNKQNNKNNKKKQNIRFIINYTCDILPNRLYNLPYDTLYKIFDPLNEKIQIKSKYSYKKKYFIYGVHQNISNISNIGYVMSLAFSLNMTLSELINTIIKKIKTHPNFFNFLLNGFIKTYVNNHEELINYIEKIFIDNNNTIIELKILKLPWNEIFMDLAKFYLNVGSIVFMNTIDFDHIAANKTFKYIDGKTKFIIYVPDELNNSNEYFNDDQYIILVRDKKNFNPIYNINIKKYWNTKEIDQKIFHFNDKIMVKMRNLIDFFVQLYLQKNNKNLTFNILSEFISYHKKYYKITTLLLNNSDECYGVLIKNIINKNIFYLPIVESLYIKKDLNISYEYINENHYGNFNDINIFVTLYNKWVNKSNNLTKSNENEKKELTTYNAYYPTTLYINSSNKRINNISNYSKINMEKWIIHKNLIIGFIHNKLNFYFKSIPISKGKKISDLPFQYLNYNPITINKIINDKPLNFKKNYNIAKAVYNSYIYTLFIIEFAQYFNENKNVKIRNNIKNSLLKARLNTTESIHKIKFSNINENDLKKIKIIMSFYVIKHRSKKKLINDFENMKYDFDKIELNKILNMKNQKDIYKILKQISKKLFITGQLKNYDKNKYVNILSTCKIKNNYYCKNKKLIIDGKLLDIFLNILSFDLLDCFKRDYILNIKFIKTTLNYFKFIKRKNEQIMIEFL